MSGATVEHSVLGANVIVSSGATIERCVIMDNCKIGANAVLKNVILDKNVIVPDGVEIGVDPDYDRERGFIVSQGRRDRARQGPGDRAPTPDRGRSGEVAEA